MELSCPVDVEDGWEVLRVAVEEKLRGVTRDKLITEFKNLRTIQVLYTTEIHNANIGNKI